VHVQAKIATKIVLAGIIVNAVNVANTVNNANVVKTVNAANVKTVKLKMANVPNAVMKVRIVSANNVIESILRLRILLLLLYSLLYPFIPMFSPFIVCLSLILTNFYSLNFVVSIFVFFIQIFWKIRPINFSPISNSSELIDFTFVVPFFQHYRGFEQRKRKGEIRNVYCC